MTEGASEIVTFDNVGLRYGTEPEVLRDVSFTLHPGMDLIRSKMRRRLVLARA